MHHPVHVSSDGMAGRRQCGVGLIEVLVAVLVLSIGFLGMAALQVRALSNNNSAMMDTQAAIAAYSILDAMRADRVNAITLAYNTTVTTGACPAVGKTLADYQLHEWCAGSGAATPDGLAALGSGTTGHVHCDKQGNCQITITFNDSLASGGTSARPVSVRGKL